MSRSVKARPGLPGYAGAELKLVALEPFCGPSSGASDVPALRQRAAAGESKTALAEEYGISRATLYATLKNVAGAAAFRAELVKVGLVLGAAE